jgi:hypothetical protein
MDSIMKKIAARILLLAWVAASARAGSPLAVGDVTLIIPGGPCWDDSLLVPSPLTASSSFTLTGVSGTGTISSVASYKADNVRDAQHVFYLYSVDLSGMSPAANHCVKLLIHFGRPLGCTYDVLVLTNGTGAVNVSSATLALLGDIDFVFGSGCLPPGKTATTFGMLSDTQPRTGSVTIIDDYTDPNSGRINETRVNVTAIVPDLPPDWAYPIQLPYLLPVPYPIFQGSLVTNPVPSLPPASGLYDFTFQLLDGSNGLPATAVVTQTVRVVNGLFNAPLPFHPAVYSGNSLWLNLSVRPPNAASFTPLNPPLAITPAPQSLYAYSAGVVADLAPGQAVTSLNGLTGGVLLQAGSGIFLSSSSNAITISAAVGSDRNAKKNFQPVDAVAVLNRLAAIPIEQWNYKWEADTATPNLGPMAQDFKAAFYPGRDDKSISTLEFDGVELAAIKGLNQKVDAENAALRARNAELEQRLEALEKIIRAQKSN